jgi:hypothetical protein
VPTVLGAQPPSRSHSAILVNDEKILVLEKGVSLNDSIWFLEVKNTKLTKNFLSLLAFLVSIFKEYGGWIYSPCSSWTC